MRYGWEGGGADGAGAPAGGLCPESRTAGPGAEAAGNARMFCRSSFLILRHDVTYLQGIPPQGSYAISMLTPSRPFPLAALLLLFLSCVSTESVQAGGTSRFGDTPILAGISFPPFADERQRGFTVRRLRKLSIDRIRIAVDWRLREPEEGRFNWEPLDRRMETAEKNGLSVFLTIASVGPDWARFPDGGDGAFLFDEEALSRFVEELLSRYGNIDKIQYGNEWEAGQNDGTAYKDFRSVEHYVKYANILYDRVKELSPGTEVVLGGLTRLYPMMEAFVNRGRYPDFSGIDLSHGATRGYLEGRIDRMADEYRSLDIQRNIDYVFANARYDMLDIHLYDDPENWSAYLSVLPRDKPIIVSEFGGPNSEFENTRPSYQVQRMEAYLAAIEKLPVREAYYFKLTDSNDSYHRDSGLYSKWLIPKPALKVFTDHLSPGSKR